MADNASYPNAVFVVLNYNSPDNLAPYLMSQHREEIESGRLVVYSSSEIGPFRMAHAKNMAHRLGILEGADILCNLDADNFTGPNFAQYIAQHFLAQNGVFLWASWERMIKHQPGNVVRGCSGRIIVSRETFMNAGGYDEKYHKWGPDDRDFIARITRLGYQGVEIEAQYLASIPHHDRMRFKEYPDARPENAGVERFEELYESDTTIVNYGRLGLGQVFRNHELKALDLRLLPTRIFGIGLHKTATTSLHSALQILGFQSGHWETGDWAKAIWTEMRAQGRSLTLEKFYALSDLPIAPLYKELDRAYPNSKFILTTRDEGKWLESVRAHWSPELNPYRWEWDLYPFSDQIHRAIYGQVEFDSEIFLARYRRHNAEVRDYFRGRKDDLLEMKMDDGAGWPQLCPFLGKEIPSVDYPRAFRTAKQ